MSGERRDFERFTILGNLTGEMMVYQPMAIREIGIGGATVETAYPLHLDSLHDLRLTLGDRSVVLKARVVHSSVIDMDQEAVIYRSGLEFVEAAERVIAAIAEYITELKTQRSSA
jgi:hypothetical protein